MTEKHLKYLIKQRIGEGTSKSDLYEEFKDKSDNTVLRKVLASRPSHDLSVKFKTSYWIVNSSWIFFILIETLGLLELLFDFRVEYLISFAISIYLAINIWKFTGLFYLSGIIWFSLGLYQNYYQLYIARSDPDFEILSYFTIVYSVIMIVGIIFMWIIQKNVFSYYHWFKPKLDSENQIRYE